MIRLLAGMPVSSTCVEAKQRAASERPPALDNPDGAAQCGARSRRRRSRTRVVEGSLRVDDIVIRGGQVVDGSGAPGRVADVVIRDGRVAAIEPGHVGPARRVIDARGRVVSPGFVDVKTHSDWTLPLNPRAESKVRQGVTTEVIGHCGFSVAPVLPGRVELLRDYLAPSAPWLPFREMTFAEYAETFPRTSVNTIMQVGHNTLRLMTMGMERREPKPDELTSMQRLLEEALDAGALGLSSGLFTAPGSHAESAEMAAFGPVLRR